MFKDKQPNSTDVEIILASFLYFFLQEIIYLTNDEQLGTFDVKCCISTCGITITRVNN